jgi:type II restriction enzyme
MKIKDLLDLYEEKKRTYGTDVYKHVSELFEEAKEIHHKDWLKHPTAMNDHEQSWRAWKGKNFEKIVLHILKTEIEAIGLTIVEGTSLERTSIQNLPNDLSQVRKKLLVNFGEFGSHLPDVDLIAYEPQSLKVLAVISVKVTLRERIAQTGYWKIKLSKNKGTEHIKVFFVTPDEDCTLAVRKPAKKGRAIVEVDTDGSYVMCPNGIEESSKVKMFDKIFDDLKKLMDP